MKVSLVKKDGRWFIKRWLFGFIPMYWVNYYNDWEFSRSEVSEDAGLQIIQQWAEEAREKAEFKAAKEETITTIYR